MKFGLIALFFIISVYPAFTQEIEFNGKLDMTLDRTEKQDGT